MTTRDLAVERIRHPLKLRLLHVIRTQLLTPRLIAITFGGDDLDDFVSASFDDHVKLFFPAPGDKEPILPGLDPKAEGAPQPIARDYTPRRFDREKRELEIQFVLHDDVRQASGPASNWAAQARPGDKLGIGGPRGSFVIPDGFDWFWLVGDATALPAIARRLEELPAASRVSVVLAVDASERDIALNSAATVDLIWVDSDAELAQAVAALPLPSGEGYVWAAGEGTAMRAVHTQLTAGRGFPKARIRASSYWKRGNAAVHETLGD